MRSLKLNDIAIKLGIRVYCNDCGAWFDPRTEHLKIRKRPCNHPPDRQRYKSTIIEPVNGSKRKRKSIIFDTRNLQEVVLLGVEYKNHVKTKAKEASKNKKPPKPKLLIESLAMFLEFKNGVGVRKHLQKHLSTSSLSSFKRQIIYWKEATDKMGEKFSGLIVNKISDDNIDSFIDYMKKYSPSVQRKTYGFFNEFYRYLNSNGYNIKSPFEGITVSNS